MPDPISAETTLLSYIKTMSDNQLVDRAAQYNLSLRRGRNLVSEGEALIRENINLYVICKNELSDRLQRRIEAETDRENESAR